MIKSFKVATWRVTLHNIWLVKSNNKYLLFVTHQEDIIDKRHIQYGYCMLYNARLCINECPLSIFMQ